ncbi:MAG: hypothetical protein AAFQ82_23945, partial [Myxococcota bacterium]
TWRSEIAEAIRKLGAVPTVDPKQVLARTAYQVRLQQLELSEEDVFAELVRAFPGLKPLAGPQEEPWGALLAALYESELLATVQTDSSYETFVDSVEDILALGALRLNLKLSGWPEH